MSEKILSNNQINKVNNLIPSDWYKKYNWEFNSKLKLLTMTKIINNIQVFKSKPKNIKMHFFQRTGL